MVRLTRNQKSTIAQEGLILINDGTTPVRLAKDTLLRFLSELVGDLRSQLRKTQTNQTPLRTHSREVAEREFHEGFVG